jgi:hypothetical protein
MKRISTLGLTVALIMGSCSAGRRADALGTPPLAVPLVINQERVVFIDEDVRVGLPSTLTGKLRVQSTGGTLYLRASEAIAPTRLQLQSVTTGEIILWISRPPRRSTAGARTYSQECSGAGYRG